MHTAPPTSPGDHERAILKAKGAKPAPKDDEVDRPGDVETLKTKLAANAVPRDRQTTSLSVLKTKLVAGAAASESTSAEDELAILKAKRRRLSASVGAGRADEVATLRAKLVADAAWTKAQRTNRDALAAKAGEGGAPLRTLLRAAVGMASARGKLELGGDTADPLRQSAFDLAFVLVLGLWGIAVALALIAGAQWWLFVLCLAATAGVLLFGLFDSAAFSQESEQE